MFRRTFVTSCLALLSTLALAIGFGRADDKSWTGKNVIIKRPGVTVQFTDADGSPQQTRIRNIIQTVRSEKDGWLEVGNSGDAGWLNKDDVVLIDEAPEFFTSQIQANPENDFAYAYRGAALQDKGDLEHALADMTMAISINPENATWYSNRGIAWNNLREYSRALADQTQAIRLNPAYAVGYNNRGLTLADKGEYQNAIGDFNEAIRIDPRYERAFLHRGTAWAKRQAYDNAVADYRQALKLDPKDPAVFNSYAWLLATCTKDSVRDGKKAVEYATKACELTNWKVSQFLDTLAAAYAENNDFDKAVQWEKKALENEDFVTRHGQAASERLLQYEDKKPFREKE
jgi:tetratricopeptide (TPR) repeat protein